MPWKDYGVEEQRWRFLKQALQAKPGRFAALCRQYGISRKCGYKWIRRLAKMGRSGLGDLSRRPQKTRRTFTLEWHREVLHLHRRNYEVGARKVRALLRAAYPRERLPSERTIHRWMRVAGVVHPSSRPPGPIRRATAVRRARQPNDVWTIDFKGWFRTADGHRVQLFTVRDLVSSYVLAAWHLRRTDEQSVARAMRTLFRRYGVPKAIRMDRGAPFCGDGPRHWSRLSVGWLNLGISLQISRRARPQDNAAHEQMHRVLKANTASPPARTLRLQRRWTDQWRRWYNEQRPHQKLQQQPPCTVYRPSTRRWPVPLRVPNYPVHWTVRLVDRRGYIFWRGKRWQIGRAFHNQRVGLCPRRDRHHVYFGSDLLGTLFRDEHIIRPVRLSSSRRSR
jgi:transposase InsO family protein